MSDKVELYEIKIIKETTKQYFVERCDGSDCVTRIEKGDNRFQLTKDASLNYFIDMKLDEQTSLAKKIKENELIIKQSETLLKEVYDVAKR